MVSGRRVQDFGRMGCRYQCLLVVEDRLLVLLLLLSQGAWFKAYS